MISVTPHNLKINSNLSIYYDIWYYDMHFYDFLSIILFWRNKLTLAIFISFNFWTIVCTSSYNAYFIIS